MNPMHSVPLAQLDHAGESFTLVDLPRLLGEHLLRLPVVSVLVLLGNVLRNTVLVALQASGAHLPSWGHDAVGLLVLAAVCFGIAWAMARPTNSEVTAL